MDFHVGNDYDSNNYEPKNSMRIMDPKIRIIEPK